MRKTIARIRVLLSPRDKWKLLGISVLMTGAALWEAVGIGLLLPVVAAVVNPQLLEQNVYLRTFYRWSPFQEHTAFMLFAAGLVVANFIFKNLFVWLVIRIQSDFIYRKQSELSIRLYRTMLEAPYSYHLEHSASELSARIGRVNWACDGTLLPLMMLASDALVVVVLLAALLWFIPGTVGAALAALAGLGLAVYWPLRKLNGRLSARFVTQDTAVTADRLNGLNGIKAVKTSGCESAFAAVFAQDMDAYARVWARIYQLGQLPRLGLETLAVLLAMGIFAGMIIGGVSTGSIVLIFALLVAAMGRLLPALSRMHYNLARLRQLGSVFDELYDDLTGISAEQDAATLTVTEYHLRESLEFHDLEFGYGSGPELFNRLNLRIPAYSSVALIGPTGGGKTTLADLTLGLLAPRNGMICADGVDIRRDLKSWRKITGYVPQFIYLADDTILANVAFGIDASRIDHGRVRRALELAHLDEVVAGLPGGLNTKIGENGVKLSGGQRQRLGIARALYREPELLILDEATSALDSATENAIVEALETLHGKVTTLVIAHRLSTIEHCEQCVNIGQKPSA